MDELQKLGYPFFSQSTLPMNQDILDRLFGEGVRAGMIKDPLDISDVWKNSYSTSTNHKVWAAKFNARHPNLVAVEVSNFKCGHDAPIYRVIEGIIESSGTPYFCFKDLGENKLSDSIKIRLKIIDYFRRRYRAVVIERRQNGRKDRSPACRIRAETARADAAFVSDNTSLFFLTFSCIFLLTADPARLKIHLASVQT